MTTAQKWRKLIAWLHRNFPIDYPMTIRSQRLKFFCGLTDYDGIRFKIFVHRKQCFTLRVDTLIHEWAHVLTWFGAETDNEDHSAEWGIQYAKIYRTFYEWNWGKGIKLEEE